MRRNTLRYCALHGLAPIPAPVHRRIVVLDLWPEDEKVQICDRLDGNELIEINGGWVVVEGYLEHQLLDSLGALVVVAHGTESSEAAPIRLPDQAGAPWALPLDRGMLALVVLALCGNDDGNLADYAADLLANGATTVLAPVGRPDALAMKTFLPHLLERLQAGDRVGDILLRAQQGNRENDRKGPWLMRLFGRGDLALSEPQAPSDTGPRGAISPGVT